MKGYMVHIKIIVGSSRPGRFGIQPAEWIHALAAKHQDAEFELVDLKEINLPFLDEAVPPLMGQYSQEHTKKWSELLTNSDGFIFVTPEYNHGPSAVLKNAIDFAAREWGYKPVSFVSYGADAGGVRAIEQLRQIVSQVRMYDLSDFVAIQNYWGQLNEKGEFVPNQEQITAAEKMLAQLIFWTQVMKDARANLPASK